MSSQWRDRDIYSIKERRSLYCLHFVISQFMGPEAYAWIFVPVLLILDIFSKSVPFVPSRGDASKTMTNPFNLTFQFERFLANVCLRPHGLVQRDRFTESVWYKLRLLSQPSCPGTNIQEYASGHIN